MSILLQWLQYSILWLIPFRTYLYLESIKVCSISSSGLGFSRLFWITPLKMFLISLCALSRFLKKPTELRLLHLTKYLFHWKNSLGNQQTQCNTYLQNSKAVQMFSDFKPFDFNLLRNIRQYYTHFQCAIPRMYLLYFFGSEMSRSTYIPV